MIEYRIFLIEPTNGTFNRGKLVNVGFVEGLKLYNFDCVIIHDVDLIPEHEKNIYECSDQPRHMAVNMNKFKYKLLYREYFGGACAMKTEQFKKINGFNNMYWGWGAEDDDLYRRVIINGLKVVRYDESITRYYMSLHSHDSINPVNPCRFKLFNYYQNRTREEGLNTLKYSLEKIIFERLFTKIVVNLLEEEAMKKLHDLVIPTNEPCKVEKLG
uniref:Glyco_transf_7C domain-containing protein n=1 Tax=Parastrongyloides trichosuri TaxID=131310 RepID=A0A0N4ZDE4_PARTI